MACAFINWYIVDEKTAGVIPVFFFFMCFYFYFAARFPKFLTAIAAGALTHVLIIGKYFPLPLFMPLLSILKFGTANGGTFQVIRYKSE